MKYCRKLNSDIKYLNSSPFHSIRPLTASFPSFFPSPPFHSWSLFSSTLASSPHSLPPSWFSSKKYSRKLNSVIKYLEKLTERVAVTVGRKMSRAGKCQVVPAPGGTRALFATEEFIPVHYPTWRPVLSWLPSALGQSRREGLQGSETRDGGMERHRGREGQNEADRRQRKQINRQTMSFWEEEIGIVEQRKRGTGGRQRQNEAGKDRKDIDKQIDKKLLIRTKRNQETQRDAER